MTFEELDQRYPNGFVDAELRGLTLNYVSRDAKLELSLRRNPPDSPNSGEYCQAVLLLTGFYYFAIEPPDADHLWYPQRPLQVDGLPEDASNFPLFEHLKAKLSKEAFCCRLFVHDWNSFIHMAAKGAQFSWVNDKLGLQPTASLQ